MRTIVLSVSILLLSMYFTACKKDDSENSDNFKSYVAYKNEKKELDKGYITANDHYIELYLMAPNVDIGQYGGTSGIGPVVSLFFYSPEATSLSVGSYSVSAGTMDRIIFTDNSASPSIVVNTVNASVEVTKGGLGNLTLTFDFENDEGEHFEGKWTGDLTISN